MKKRIIFVLTAAMLLISPVMLSSCSKDENDPPSSPNNNQPKTVANYTVSFSSAYGTPPQNISVKDGDKLSNGNLNKLYAEGYIFMGWYYGEQKVEAGFVVKSNINLVAKWEKEKTFKVTFASDFGEAPQEMYLKQGGAFTAEDLKEPTTIGYKFLGWYIGSTKVESGFTVDKDIFLVAKWEKCAIYAAQMYDFMAMQTDETVVCDVSIADVNPDMDAVVKALKDNPKVKINLNLENCTELKELSIMPVENSISKSKGDTFLANLVSLTMPESVTSVVLGCDGLTSINIPNSVTSVVIYAEKPPTIRNANTMNSDCKIYVTKECLDAYKNAKGWSLVAAQIQTIGGTSLYIKDLKDFMLKQTDESSVCDIKILDKNPDLELLKEALNSNEKIKVNLNLEECTELKEVYWVVGRLSSTYALEYANTTLRTLTLPNTITYFHLGACEGLCTLSMPNSITELSLQYCDGLTYLDIPNSVTSLDLSDCHSLESFDIPISVKSLSLCNLDISSLTIPNSITSLDLKMCNKLTSLTIPNSVAHFNLRECAITSLTIPGSITDVKIEKCNGLSSLDIENGVKNVYLWKCGNLKSINIPNSVTELKLENCSGLSSLNVPDNVTNLKLWDCTELTSIDVSYGVKHLNIDNCPKITSLDIPNSVTDLTLFCSGLTSLRIPNNVTTLDLRKLNLTELDIPNSVTDFTLWECAKLSTINVPDNVSTLRIGECSNLTKLNIPYNVAKLTLFEESISTVTFVSTMPPSFTAYCAACKNERQIEAGIYESDGSVCGFYVNEDCSIYVPYSSFDSYKKTMEDYVEWFENFYGFSYNYVDNLRKITE
ncbi:MAG: leucine-rich repeat protein [Bacteroidales bacterium]|nr:leucine-rich repeat protein [Bacteroidales bacterium]